MPRISCHLVYSSYIFFDEAVNSILTQTFADYELVLIADGVEHDPIVNKKVKHLFSSGGQYKARNAAIAATDSEFIAVMDADDVAMPDRFEKQIKAIGDLAWLGTAATLINAEGDRVGEKRFPCNHDELIGAYRSIHPTALLRRDAGIAYPEDWPVAGDVGLWVDLINRGFKVGNLPDALLKKREHPSQVSARQKSLQEKAAHHYLMADSLYAASYQRTMEARAS